jgi:hypothetical protein
VWGVGSTGEAMAQEISGVGDKGGTGSAGEPVAQEEVGARAEEAKKKRSGHIGVEQEAYNVPGRRYRRHGTGSVPRGPLQPFPGGCEKCKAHGRHVG